MNKLVVSFFILLAQSLVFSQESLEPLGTNYQLIKQNRVSSYNRSSPVENNDFIYLTDTLHLPIVDDFSTDKYKQFDADVNDVSVSDSMWYALFDVNGNPVSNFETFMGDTSYEYYFDSTQINGVDTLIEYKTPLNSSYIYVQDLSLYPITISVVEVWPNTTIYDSSWTIASPDMAIVDNDPDFQQDSLTLYFVPPGADDLNKLWLDNSTYKNTTYPINPLTIGVATFDGLNNNGYPYDWSASSAVGWSDELTSKPLFLYEDNSGNPYAVDDSVYLTFWYQAGGIGESPDMFDSLRLEYYIPSQNAWQRVWSVGGFTSDDWFFQHFLLDDTLYFQDGFQFRFSNYGSQTGSLDHWHLDYVILGANRSFSDTVMNDWAFQYEPSSMLEEYTSMPWKHYTQVSQDVTLSEVIISSYNSSASNKFLQPAAMDLFYDNTLLNTIPYNPTALNVPALSNFDMIYNLGNSFEFDPTVADTFAVFDARFYLATNTTPERLSENDTIYHQQEFKNYYAYDDGTAEAAYGLVSAGAELAYRFELPVGIYDTIRAVQIHFSPSVNDASNDPFFLQIWDDSAGQPGSLIYTTDDVNLPKFYYPKYNLGVNGFCQYELPFDVPVSGTYYVGWKQSSTNRLNIGFDKNINRQIDIFYKIGSSWSNTQFEGALMLRPVFVSLVDNLVGKPIFEISSKFDIYPNPCKNLLSISYYKSIKYISVYDLQGRIIYQNNSSQEIDVSLWNNGVYIVNAHFNNGSINSKKLIVQH